MKFADSDLTFFERKSALIRKRSITKEESRFSIYYEFITHAKHTSEHALVKYISVLVISLKKANVHEANTNSFVSLLLNYEDNSSNELILLFPVRSLTS